MSINLIKKISLFALILLLTSCASFMGQESTQQHHLPWPTRQKQLSNFETWNLDAVASVRYQKTNNVVYLTWQKNIKDYTLSMSGPFNLDASQIKGNGNRIELWQQGKRVAHAQTPEQLIQKEFGFYLPISNLTYWIKAMPNPKLKYKASFDKYNHIIYLSQQKWQITYKNFSSINGIDLPKTIWLNNSELNIHIKIVNRNWAI